MGKKNKLKKPTLAGSKTVIGFSVVMPLLFVGMATWRLISNRPAQGALTHRKSPSTSSERRTRCRFRQRWRLRGS